MDIKYDITYINNVIYKYLCDENSLSKLVREAMNKAVINGGKRVRPLLILETYKLCGGKNIDILHPFMAGIEFIHTFSLIHDDLPCIDNDELRRGKKSTWAEFGEDMAVLAGDALSIEAFRIITTAMLDLKDESIIKRYIKALDVLGKNSGIDGMVGGQVLDVQKTGENLSKEELYYIYTLKTGALIEASMLIGAILAGADEFTIEKVKKLAFNIGMSFQIKDDILDETSSSEELGKPVHSDRDNNKNTYVSIYGLEYAKKYLEKMEEDALILLDSFEEDSSKLKEIVAWLIKRAN